MTNSNIQLGNRFEQVSKNRLRLLFSIIVLMLSCTFYSCSLFSSGEDKKPERYSYQLPNPPAIDNNDSARLAALCSQWYDMFLKNSGFHQALSEVIKLQRLYGGAGLVLLIDDGLPETEPVDVARIRGIRGDLPVLMVSGLADAIEDGDMSRLGIQGTLCKPHGLEQLDAAIREALSSMRG